jgi:hypothetical protein
MLTFDFRTLSPRWCTSGLAPTVLCSLAVPHLPLVCHSLVFFLPQKIDTSKKGWMRLLW